MIGQLRERVVVVGNGMAGFRFVQELVDRDLDRRLDITVVGDEPGGAYNRMQLSNVLAGVTRAEDVLLADEPWYAGQRIELRSRIAVTAIDRKAHTVQLADGTVLPYEFLVLATGSAAVVPPVVGIRERDELVGGVVAFRTVDDCALIADLARGARHAVVVGGGILGLEAARGISGLGVGVTVLQRGERIMEQQLDRGAAQVLHRILERDGVKVRTDAGLAEVLGNPVRGVRLDDGSIIDTDLVVLSCGVRPRTELAVEAGLAVRRGVLVGDDLRSTSDHDVFAIGECAEHRGQTYGLVAPAWEQARVAADVIAGGTTTYEGSAVVTRLKAAGIELATMGDATADSDDDVCFVDGRRGVYQKLVVRDGRLAGAILLGDTRTVGTVTQLFDRGALVPLDRASLLHPRRGGEGVDADGSPTLLPDSATVCQCNGVTKGRICAAWGDGARSVTELARATRATTGCGTCRDTVAGLAEWLGRADPDTAQAAVVQPSIDSEPIPA